MSVPVHPICSGGKPDSNGGVAQGLRDAVDCSLQPSGRITTEAKSGGEGCSRVMEGVKTRRAGIKQQCRVPEIITPQCLSVSYCSSGVK